MKAVIYARVSTADQHNAIQIGELTAYVERRGWELAGVYQDTMSGAKASIPGLDKLMSDARQRRFDAVLVWKLDRFGRSLGALCQWDSGACQPWDSFYRHLARLGHR